MKKEITTDKGYKLVFDERSDSLGQLLYISVLNMGDILSSTIVTSDMCLDSSIKESIDYITDGFIGYAINLTDNDRKNISKILRPMLRVLLG